MSAECNGRERRCGGYCGGRMLSDIDGVAVAETGDGAINVPAEWSEQRSGVRPNET